MSQQPEFSHLTEQSNASDKIQRLTRRSLEITGGQLMAYVVKFLYKRILLAF